MWLAFEDLFCEGVGGGAFGELSCDFADLCVVVAAILFEYDEFFEGGDGERLVGADE